MSTTETTSPVPASGSGPTFSLFPNGTSFESWYCQNCDRCTKGPGPEPEGENPLCNIETAIALACCTDGTLLNDGINTTEAAADMARRLNWDGRSYLPHNCPEFVPLNAQPEPVAQ